MPRGIPGIISTRHSKGIKSVTRAVLAKRQSRLPSTKGIANERVYGFASGNTKDFYKEQLGNSQIHPVRVAVRTVLVFEASLDATRQSD
jgi:bisphosphoglycerate-dependent phosphoglycerate mutase